MSKSRSTQVLVQQSRLEWLEQLGDEYIATGDPALLVDWQKIAARYLGRKPQGGPDRIGARR